MVWELCTSAGAIRKAGVNANSTITASGGALAAFYNAAEGDLIARTRKDWKTGVATIEAGVLKAINNVMENEIATRIILYEPDAWDLSVAQTKLDILKNNTDITMASLIDDNSNSIREVE